MPKKRKQSQLSLDGDAPKRGKKKRIFLPRHDDHEPRDIGMNLIRVTQQHMDSRDFDFVTQCEIDEQVVSQDAKYGLLWVRGTERMREIFGGYISESSGENRPI